MNIIFFLGERRKSVRLFLSPLTSIAALILVAALVVVLSVAGYRHVEKRLLEDELQALQELRTSTETSMNAMASRLSVLQSHVMRLDALGFRLASMAELDDIEFGVENPPGIGGVQTMLDNSSRELSDFDFLISLNRLEQALRDRRDKLSAMESMLMGRSLQDQALPQGNPAKGGWISSLFGYRSDPISGQREFHQGVDLAGKSGLPVTSVASGIVTRSGPNQGYGNLVEISHGDDYVTRYAHNSENLVAVGEKVEKGEVIAIMGSSGRSTGTHVHFEVVRNGKHVNPGQTYFLAVIHSLPFLYLSRISHQFACHHLIILCCQQFGVACRTGEIFHVSIP